MRLSVYLWADFGPGKGFKARHIGLASTDEGVHTLIDQAMAMLDDKSDTAFFTLYPEHPKAKPEPTGMFGEGQITLF